jgi:hypothetical protein
MTNILEKISGICDIYSDNEAMMDKINQYVDTLVSNTHMEYKRQIDRIDKQNRDKKDRIDRTTDILERFETKFNAEYPYGYCGRSERFILYDGNDYISGNEDSLLENIFGMASNDDDFRGSKYKIKTMMIKKIKEISPLRINPSDNTIDSIINSLYPIYFPSIDDVKLFLITLGMCLLEKNTDQYTVMYKSSIRNLLKMIENEHFVSFGDASRLSSFKMRFKDYSYNHTIFIKSNEDDSLPCYPPHKLMNLLCVACHLSRICTIDEFIDNPIYQKCVRYSLYLRNKTPNDILDEFLHHNITNCKGMHMSDTVMGFVWNKFNQKLSIPDVIGKSKMIEMLQERLEYNYEKKKFINITSIHAPSMYYFTKFLAENITESENEMENEYTTAEIIFLFKKWFDKRLDYNITGDLVMNVFREQYPDTIKNDDTIVCNLSSWDKNDIISKIYYSTIREGNVKIDDIYDKYLGELDNEFPIITKKYFEYFSKNLIKRI